MLSREDIKKYIISGDIQIYPFEKKNLTGIGYNLSTTHFAFSINKGILLTVYTKTTPDGEKHYVIIPKNDTVLFFSKEYIGVSNKIAGTFHSKVGRVCQGLGHISTTLDPTWHGQLIISVNNPTSTDIKFDLDGNSGNIFTLLLYKFDTEVLGTNIHDNNSGRCDLLLERFTDPTNKKYHEKHLELKEYVINEFANSLNGYDNFLNTTITDEYTKKINALTNIKSRLENDCVIISEDRYVLGSDGHYSPLKNTEEEALIHSCILFKLAETTQPDNISIWQEIIANNSYNTNENTLIINIIKEYLRIINYELQMINHIRRVKWQNEKTMEFAGEKSELVVLRKESNIADQKRSFLYLFLAAFITLLITIILILLPCLEEIVKDAVIALFSIVMALLLQLLHKKYKKYRYLKQH